MRRAPLTKALWKEIPIGKYTRWAENLEQEDLAALLACVGGFGRRVLELRQKQSITPRGFTPDGGFFYPSVRLYGGLGASCRAEMGMEGMVIAYAQQPLVLFGRPFGFDFPLSFLTGVRRAFARGFRRELEKSPQTRWASNMREDRLLYLFWSVGEFEGRAFSLSFEASAEDDKYLRNCIDSVLGIAAPPSVLRWRERMERESSGGSLEGQER